MLDTMSHLLVGSHLINRYPKVTLQANAELALNYPL